jgi:uncharacterized pyridoxamine 5'-phosphate oxidase family protein
MHETPEEVAELQRLLDASYAAAGPHLRSIHTDNWKMSAEQVVDRLQGMCILSLATVNSKGEPIASPVDGVFFRGRFWCGSANDSMRARHIRQNAAVSLTHTVGEELAITVHGRAVKLEDKTTERALGFRECLVSIYGEEMIASHWSGGALYWEIEPRRMFALAPVIS